MTTPCCGAQVRVADVRFHVDGVFACFAVGALENSDSDFWEDEHRPYGYLNAEALRRFEDILGRPVLQIWECS